MHQEHNLGYGQKKLFISKGNTEIMYSDMFHNIVKLMQDVIRW